MGAFAEAQTCRRLVLLNYFGEGKQQACGNCDICLDPPKRYDGLEGCPQGTVGDWPRWATFRHWLCGGGAARLQ
ncbi:ATP-dependent DNA helicase recQ [Serratia fonticola]|uniref:ATP-dependent DNA helicase recQ n=1 Tax=Serratia fonticola TaxID=47917 RepID=A0A4U9VVP9_SERFO|nr:ATP-dependent DNA helicase recQ [Serratia fonticola]